MRGLRAVGLTIAAATGAILAGTLIALAERWFT